MSGQAGFALTRWERCGLALLLLAVVLQGVNVQIRSTRLKRSMTDLGVYTTAAWAIRSGVDPYDVTDTNGWHYVYPPLFAILMGPLATAPPGADPVPAVPFAMTVALWHVFAVVCGFLAAHWLASALEATSADRDVRNQPRASRHWWTLRALPLLVCLPPILDTLVHGQVNLLLLLLLSGMIASVVRGRHWRAGLCLGGAICLKVFPAFLLVYVVWRRNWRCLGGCAAGLLLGVVAIPMVVLGPTRTLDYNRKLAAVVLLPGLGQGADDSRREELTGVIRTDSQAVLAIAHNTLHPDRATRPETIASTVRNAATLVGLLLTGVTLLAAGYRKRGPATREVMFLGALVINMLLLCPVCHLSYFCLLVPLVMAIVEEHWLPARAAVEARGSRVERRHGLILRALTGLFVLSFLAGTLVHIPGLEPLRDFGAAMYAALGLWLFVIVLMRNAEPGTVEGPAPAERRTSLAA